MDSMKTLVWMAGLVGCGDVVDPAPISNLSATPGRAEYTFDHDGLQRRFQIYIPANHVDGRPLVVVLHGGGGNASQMFKRHPLQKEADDRGLIVVAAEGTSEDGSTSSFGWNNQIAIDSGVDDVGYLEEVITHVTTSLGIDEDRRYLAGFSGGASMSIRFAAEKSEYVAAIATFAGKVGISISGAPFAYPSVPTTPLSVQLTYGTLDPNLEGELDGDYQATSAREGIDWWASALGCTSTPQTAVDDIITSDTFACPSGVVRMNTVQGMKHMWPDPPDDLIAGTEMLFDFFADKTKP
jgi:polyhydroxybutyrate depolymerase